MQTVQTDNGTEFTYKYISDDMLCPFDKALSSLRIKHKLIPPRTPWHNGKVERSHRNDQKYFYDWEKFRSVEELNEKLAEHLKWSNNKVMNTLGRKSPVQILKEKWKVIRRPINRILRSSSLHSEGGQSKNYHILSQFFYKCGSHLLTTQTNKEFLQNFVCRKFPK